MGQPTGGSQRGINGGAFFFLRLPNSGIEMDLPLIGTFPAKPMPDAGLTPDVQVVRTVDDLAEGRDAAMLAGGEGRWGSKCGIVPRGTLGRTKRRNSKLNIGRISGRKSAHVPRGTSNYLRQQKSPIVPLRSPFGPRGIYERRDDDLLICERLFPLPGAPHKATLNAFFRVAQPAAGLAQSTTSRL